MHLNLARGAAILPANNVDLVSSDAETGTNCPSCVLRWIGMISISKYTRDVYSSSFQG